jgi:hypothetical protein
VRRADHAAQSRWRTLAQRERRPRLAQLIGGLVCSVNIRVMMRIYAAIARERRRSIEVTAVARARNGSGSELAESAPT